MLVTTLPSKAPTIMKGLYLLDQSSHYIIYRIQMHSAYARNLVLYSGPPEIIAQGQESWLCPQDWDIAVCKVTLTQHNLRPLTNLDF